MYQTRMSLDGKIVFFLSSSTSDGLVQNCVTISQWFSHKSATAFYSEHCTSPSLFHNCEVSQGTLNCCCSVIGGKLQLLSMHLLSMHLLLEKVT